MPDETSTTQRRQERTRQAILDAAQEIILEQGMGQLSMRALAEKVDYTPAALYKYFKNKDDLVEAIRQEGWALMAQYYRQRLRPGLSQRETLIETGLAYQDFATLYPAYYLMMFSSTQSTPRSLEDLKNDPNFTNLLRLIEQGVADGSMRLPEGYTALMLRLHIWFLSHGIAMLKLTLMRDDRAALDTLSHQILEAFTNSFAPENPPDTPAKE